MCLPLPGAERVVVRSSRCPSPLFSESLILSSSTCASLRPFAVPLLLPKVIFHYAVYHLFISIFNILAPRPSCPSARCWAACLRSFFRSLSRPPSISTSTPSSMAVVSLCLQSKTMTSLNLRSSPGYNRMSPSIPSSNTSARTQRRTTSPLFSGC